MATFSFRDSFPIHIPALSLTLSYALVLLLFVCSSSLSLFWSPACAFALFFVAATVAYGRFEFSFFASLPLLLPFVVLRLFLPDSDILVWLLFFANSVSSVVHLEGLGFRYKYGRQPSRVYLVGPFLVSASLALIACCLSASSLALSSCSIVERGALLFASFLSVPFFSVTLQKWCFDILISRPTQGGNPPYTFVNIFRSLLIYLAFAVCCLLMEIMMLLATMLFVPGLTRRRFGCRILCLLCRALFSLTTYLEQRKIGEFDDTRPAVVVANHQSFLDILFFIAMSPRLILVVKDWVWSSPVFGFMVRQLGYVCIKEGYEDMTQLCRQRLDEGFSIAIFPEGSRYSDGDIHRFHKGAFWLSQQLHADIVPVLFCGNNYVLPKQQLFNMCKGTSFTKVLPRIMADDLSFGADYHEKTKLVAAYMRREYATLCDEYRHVENSTFYHRLVTNYIFKGPVVEWYMRVKIQMEHSYLKFDKLVPQDAVVTDIGCGMGPLCFMLSILSPGRDILGLDYDAQKIAVAQAAWLRRDGVDFDVADASACTFRQSDVFILNDILHYLPRDVQQTVVANCARSLNPGGMIVVRDGDSQKSELHSRTRLTEFLSTRVFRFNKTACELDFVGEDAFRQMAADNNLTMTSVSNDSFTSNTIFILKR